MLKAVSYPQLVEAIATGRRVESATAQVVLDREDRCWADVDRDVEQFQRRLREARAELDLNRPTRPE